MCNENYILVPIQEAVHLMRNSFKVVEGMLHFEQISEIPPTIRKNANVAIFEGGPILNSIPKESISISVLKCTFSSARYSMDKDQYRFGAAVLYQ